MQLPISAAGILLELQFDIEFRLLLHPIAARCENLDASQEYVRLLQGD
jgi:hypothetical protein